MTPPCPRHSPGGWALYQRNTAARVDWVREAEFARSACAECAKNQGKVGSARGVRTMAEKPKSDRRRTKCPCCGQRVTHVGLGDDVALMSGCEWYVRRWVRDPDDLLRQSLRRQSDGQQ